MQIAHKNIILTGAASGIGKALLNQLVDFEGIKVIAVDLNNIENASDKIIPFICDLSQQSEVDRLFTFAIAHLQTIDIFIANAGFAYYEIVGNASKRFFKLMYFRQFMLFRK